MSHYSASRVRTAGIASVSLQTIPPLLRGWNPLTTVAMILGFVLYWPVGLAIIAWNWMTHPFGRSGRRAAREAFRGSRDSGNTAFEDWKGAELERLEAERQKLAAAQAEFSGFVDQLKRAKDREEFERFMTNRNTPAA